MPQSIFLIDDKGELCPMPETAYDSEKLLQGLLAKYPDLLAGESADDGPSRRWLLVRREMRIADDHDGAGRWSLDHLFLDEDGVPTLVEVKRSSDTRIRREVVGQMLDYAANAVTYWPVERIRAEFTGSTPDHEQKMREFLATEGEDDDGESGDSNEEEAFWDKVRTNLDAERIRLVFVADDIPSELQRIVEFLDGQMAPAEVLAIEVKQYIGHGQKALVPKLVGRTARAARRKGRTGGSSSNESISSDDFDADFKAVGDLSPRAAAARVLLDRLRSVEAVRLEYHRTPKGQSKCRVSRTTDNLGLLAIGASQLLSKCGANAPRGRFKWPHAMVENFEAMIGKPLSHHGGELRDWLGESEENVKTLLRWVERCAGQDATA